MALADKTGLLIKIGADVKDATKGLQDVRDKVSNLGNVARSAGSGDLSGLIDGLAGTAAGAGPVGIAAAAATAAVAALGAAAVTATATAFEFAKQASELGSTIYDASVQTGLGAEALSSLKIAGEQADMEFGKIVQSINKFSLLVGDAASGSDKASETLAKFGLTGKQAATDLEGSLATIIKKISELPPGVEKANAAAAAFGARGGKDMLKLIDQMDGDLPGLIAKMKDLGLTIDDEAARAADNFGDKLTILGMRFDMAKVKIGLEVMPAFERFFDFMDGKLKQNGASLENWAKRVGNVFMGVEVVLERLVNFFVENRLGRAIAKTVELTSPLIGLVKILEDIGAGVERPAAPEPEKDTGTGTFTGGGGGGGKAGADKAKAEADKKRQDALEYIRQTYQILQREVQDALDAWRKQFEPEFSEGSLVYPSAEDIAVDFESAKIAIEEGYQKLIDSQKEQLNLELQDSELSAKARETLTLKYNEIILKLERDRAEAIKQIRIKSEMAASVDKEREMNRRLAEIDAEHEILIEEINRTESSEAEKLNSIRDLRVQRLEIEKLFLGALADLEKTDIKRHEDYLKRIEEIDKRIKELKGEMTTDTEGGGLPEMDTEHFGLGKSTMVDEATGKLDVMAGLMPLMIDSFKQLAQGIGNVIQNWVLMGDVGPNAMRKMTAAVLAGLAAQAAVQALMEVAFGLADLARFYVTLDPRYMASSKAHFAAAAVFGAVAGVAAVAGRAMAGDLFKNESGRATGNSQGGGENGKRPFGQYSSQGDATINQTQAGVSLRPTAEIVIKDASGMFSQLFEAEIRNNSNVRRLIIDTANA